MQKAISTWKKVGKTPLEAVEGFKKDNPEYRDETISYAGRLDPMAEGVLLLLIGDENKKRKEYEGLQKEYKTEVVLGVTTDSFDSLGIIEKTKSQKPIAKSAIENTIHSFIGKKKQMYPPYSSKPVNGKPLYWWARQNKLSEIKIPEKEIEIYDLVFGGRWLVDGEKLSQSILKKIQKVEGDFRQDQILKQWEEFGKDYAVERFQVLKLSVTCSSGTYIRRLASDIGEKLSCGAFCLSITRTKVGDFTAG